MQTNDLLEAATLVCKAFWEGADKSRLNLRECMSDLRVAVQLEQKRRSQESTQLIERPK